MAHTVLSKEIRKKFQNYFGTHKHHWEPSASLIPKADSGLLFTNAGMNPFKDYFLGIKTPSHKKLCSIQKCLRAGGKHNDLEEVGDSPYHHTFFEMMGYFSFGEYFKKEACALAFNFLTKELGFPRKTLWVSVFKEDKESADIWQKTQNIPSDRIFFLGEKDNFWRMNNTGPCGPCSEIFYYDGPKKTPTPKDMTEIWNLVFMEFNEDSQGRKSPLPRACVDTGMGLERLLACIEGKQSNYHTDLFSGILESLEKSSGKKYDFTEKSQNEQQKAFRVVADHSRAVSFLITAGVLPGSDGRSYVLRRILRRGLFYGNKLNPDLNLLNVASEAVIQTMGFIYPELKKEKKLIQSTIEEEAKLFTQSLKEGRSILLKKIGELENKTLPNPLVWLLYSTYGFPPDLTRLIAQEKGFTLREDFSLQKFKEQDKSSVQKKILNKDLDLTSLKNLIPTQFTGYEKLKTKAIILKKISSPKGEWLILDQTCFYPEGGGPIGDRGLLKTKTGQAEVEDCQKKGGFILHKISNVKGEIKEGEQVELEVSSDHRKQIASSHSATHLLHQALRKVLSSSVRQQGSLIKPGFLRFDFSSARPLSPVQLKDLEQEVQTTIEASEPVSASFHPYKEAINQGALYLKGENYPDKVRVIRMGASLEFCGGIHVQNTRDIQGFKIISETGVQSGVRRIVAYTHDKLKIWEQKMAHQNKSLRRYLKMTDFKKPEEVNPFIHWFLLKEEEIKGLKQQLQQALSPLKKTYKPKIKTFKKISTESGNFLVRQNEELRQYLKLSLPKEVEEDTYLITFAKKKEEEVRNLKKQVENIGKKFSFDQLLKKVHLFKYQNIKGNLLVVNLPIEDNKTLREVADQLKGKLTLPSIVVILGEGKDSHPIIVCVSKELQKDLGAQELLKNKIAVFLGGGGGGRPRFAQGKVKNKDRFSELSSELLRFLR